MATATEAEAGMEMDLLSARHNYEGCQLLMWDFFSGVHERREA